MEEKYLIKEQPILHESGARLGTQKSYSIPICDKDNCKQLQQYKQQIDELNAKVAEVKLLMESCGGCATAMKVKGVLKDEK